MYIVKVSQINKTSPSSSIAFLEYPMGEQDISSAIAEIHGRYPEEGFAVNEACRELVYVLKGTGQIMTEKGTQSFESGDVVFINRGEKFSWEGNFSMFMVTTPKFSPEQHNVVK